MLAQARCGKHEEAAAAAAELQQRRPTEANVQWQAACCYALCSSAVVHGKAASHVTDDDRVRQQRYTTQAVAALRQAKANGYKDVHNLEVDPDLDPIRGGKEFYGFMLEFKEQ